MFKLCGFVQGISRYSPAHRLPRHARGEGGGGDTEPPGGLGGDLAGWDS